MSIYRYLHFLTLFYLYKSTSFKDLDSLAYTI